MSTATDKKWGRAAWLSGALLVVPLAGMVALFALTGDDDDRDPPRPVVEEPVVTPVTPVTEVTDVPTPVAPRPTPRPVAPVADEVAEPRVVEEAPEPEPVEPSVLDPCCEALRKLATESGVGTIGAAYETCTNGRTFDDPNVAYKAMARILERDGYEVPRECRP